MLGLFQNHSHDHPFNLWEVFVHILPDIGFVMLMMIVVELLTVLTKGRVNRFLQRKKIFQYPIATVLGVIPGCEGAYTTITFYLHGFLSFGALTGSMIATSGEAGWVFIRMTPGYAFMTFGLLILLGLLFGWLTDKIFSKLNLTLSAHCKLQVYHDDHEHMLKHLFKDHLLKHIIKKHLWRIILLLFLSAIIVEYMDQLYDLKEISNKYSYLFLLICALVSIIPDSSPLILIVSLFVSGNVSFAVLLTSAMIQDGHGLVPLLSYSIKDSLYVKLFNVAYGLIIGTLVYLSPLNFVI